VIKAIRHAELGDVAEFVRGVTFKPNDVIPVSAEKAVACMRTKNVQIDLDTSDVWGLPASFVKRDAQLLRRGDILVSSANSWNLVGKCCWVPSLPWPATLGGFISALRPKNGEIEPRYLYWWFASGPIQAEVRSCARQTTNIANLSLEQCLAINLPIPPLDEQRRIAVIMDQADDLRRKRREAISYFDSLRDSIFFEMFGRPLDEGGAGNRTKFVDVTDRITYGFTSPMTHVPSGIPILTAKTFGTDTSTSKMFITQISANMTR
jgi:type I restriction enzyme S subunit